MKEWSTCQSNYSIHNRHYGHCSWICLVVCSIAPSHLLWSLLLFCRAVAVFFRVHITNWCLPSVTPCRGLPSLLCALFHLWDTLLHTHFAIFVRCLISPKAIFRTISPSCSILFLCAFHSTWLGRNQHKIFVSLTPILSNCLPFCAPWI